MEAIAPLALLFALVAVIQIRLLSKRVSGIESETRLRLRDQLDAARNEIDNVRRLLALVAEGASPTREQILAGRLWRDISAEEATRLGAQADFLVLDVRNPEETAGGTIPGALLIPLDQLERRHEEIPGEGMALLVTCAMGMRSAAACELLSSLGYGRLYNLSGGMGAWTGPVEVPTPA